MVSLIPTIPNLLKKTSPVPIDNTQPQWNRDDLIDYDTLNRRILENSYNKKTGNIRRYEVDENEPFISLILNAHSDVFYSNPKTAEDNTYQDNEYILRFATDAELETLADDTASDEAKAAINNALVQRLSKEVFKEWDDKRDLQARNNILTLAFKAMSGKPDAIFPNNSVVIRWVDGEFKAMLCPMSPGRQEELPPETLAVLEAICGKDNVLDLRHLQPEGEDENQQGLCLEGTGVMNFSPDGKHLYVNTSYRANRAFVEYAKKFFGCEKVHTFRANNAKGDPVYHTNVMHWVGEETTAICWEGIEEGEEKEALRQHFIDRDIDVIELTQDQIDNFAGNGLEVKKIDGQDSLLLSQRAFKAFFPDQQAELLNRYHVVYADEKSIEVGGGSERCLDAQIRGPKSAIVKAAIAIVQHFGDKLFPPTPFQQQLMNEQSDPAKQVSEHYEDQAVILSTAMATR